MYSSELQTLLYDIFKKNLNGIKSDRLTREVPKQLGTGHISIQTIDKILFTEQYINSPENLTFCDLDNFAKKEYCFLTFTLEGDSYFQTINQKKSYQFPKNRASLGISKEDEKYKMDIKKDQIWQYTFNFSKETLLDYLIEFDDTNLINKVEDAQQFDIFKHINLSASHHYMIEKMLNNPYHGSLKNLYFESCTIELFITLLKDLSIKKVYDVVLNDGDKERLIKAKEILLHDLQNPPTIEVLARKVALNQDKLKKGFKSMFGKTIFNLLTEQRMKIAYEDLQKNDLSISEVAYKVGYIGVSNFISVFKKQYGKTPGQMRKERSFYWFE